MPFGASLTENVRCTLTSSAGATAGGSTMGSSVADAEDSEEVVSLLDSEVAEVSAVVCVALVYTDDVRCVVASGLPAQAETPAARIIASANAKNFFMGLSPFLIFLFIKYIEKTMAFAEKLK